MKKLLLSAMLGLAGLMSAPTYALDESADFQVRINLYPKCELTIPPASQIMAVEYVSFQTDAVQRDYPFSSRCTQGIAYNLSIVGTSGTSGTLVGIPYTVGVVTASGTGTGSAVANNIRINIAANQGGNCVGGQVNSTTTGAQSGTSGTGGATAGVGTACVGTSTVGNHVLKVVY